MNLWARSTIEYLKDKYGFRFSRSLGQNFLTDPWPLEAMIEGSGITSDDLVIEIGPGIGTLTVEAAKAAAHVTSIEIDESLRPILDETLGEYDNIDVVFSDIMTTDIKKLIEDRREEYGIRGKTRLIGNLPYYITTPIVFKLLEEDTGASSITIMTQKEVADRMKAAPGGKDYGGLSIMVQYHCRVEQVATVSKEVFYPKPKVDSAVVNFEILEEKQVKVHDERLFSQVVKAGFGQRRKTLSNSMAAGLNKPKQEINEILQRAEVCPGRRAETLTIEEFARITNEITKG